ncbi:transporter substrate-binding domain-containing protein [Aidingimonas lacisalsi]|uniref:transporter substrate-binding domain-containing protein n=1 Tax=Aidingimonas lacisalsi TaxID=2604086 RepID=UPI0011D24147|nr:transporter substrate-binding domain-containing protein [Aidingimonas lacisalsi]
MNRLLTLTMMGAAFAMTASASVQAQDDETVRFGVDVPYEPMEYRDADGNLTGFDIELGNALCEEIGIECEWVVQGWDGIIPGLQSRKYDAIMSSMTINDDRREQVLFSDPYITPPSAWFIPTDSEIDDVSEEGLDGFTIGVQRGTLQDNYATDMYGDVADINRYDTAEDLVLDMESQRADIAFLDFPVGKATLIDNEEYDYQVIGNMITEPKEYFGDGFGIAFRKRDEALAERFNEALETLRDNGTYDEIYDKYFSM